jgi:hypothetical protein
MRVLPPSFIVIEGSMTTQLFELLGRIIVVKMLIRPFSDNVRVGLLT